MRTTLKKIWTLAALLGGGLTLVASPAWCQAQIPLSRSLDQISPEPQVIRAQVAAGARLADQAITILESTDDPGQLEQAKNLVQKSYVMLRYAAHGCELRKNNATVVENRLLMMAIDNINAARERQRTAEIAIGNSIPWPESRAQYVSEALDQLQSVSALAQRAAPLIR